MGSPKKNSIESFKMIIIILVYQFVFWPEASFSESPNKIPQTSHQTSPETSSQRVPQRIPQRIRSIHFDKGKVEKIYMAPGLVTTLIFRCDIDEVIIGSSEDLKAVQSETSKKRINLFVNSATSMPTNLVVGCGKSNTMYVFDVIPSEVSHQDIVSIFGSYGGPGFLDLSEIKIDPTKKESKIPNGAVLVEESNNGL